MFNQPLAKFLLVFLAVALIAGCATSQQAPPAQNSGFLDDYSIMRPGVKGEAGLIYEYPLSNWRTFNKMIVAPVVILQPEGKGLPEEDRQRLATNLWLLLREELGKDYRLVEMADAKTLRLQVALTDVDKASSALDTITSIVPVGLVISKSKEFMTGKPSFVGEVSIEGKISDAQLGTLLAAAVDRRVGGKALKGTTDSWDDINQSLEIWAQQIRFRLCEWSKRTGCVDPAK